MVLHDYELSADCYKVRLFMALAGIAHDLRRVDVYPGRENEGAAFRAMAPMARVPVLEDDGVTVETAEAILIHLAETRAPSWLPTEPGPRARTLAWLVFAARDGEAANEARLADVLGTPMGDVRTRTTRALNALEDALVEREIDGGTDGGTDGHAFLAGPAPTIADVAAFAPVALAVEFGEDLSLHPATRRWTRAVRALPGFRGMPGVPEFV